jgi:hypothetical protein
MFAALVLTVFLSIAGTGVAKAGWSTVPVNVAAAATAATTAVALSGSAGLNTELKLQLLDRVTVAPLKIENLGQTPLRLFFSVGGITNNVLASQVSLMVWKSDEKKCGKPPSEVETGTLLVPPVLPLLATDLPARESFILCAATELNSTKILEPVRSLTATITITGTVGENWTTTSSDVPFTQRFCLTIFSC